MAWEKDSVLRRQILLLLALFFPLYKCQLCAQLITVQKDGCRAGWALWGPPEGVTASRVRRARGSEPDEGRGGIFKE